MTEKILQLNTEKNIFWTLVGILLLCAGFYMYSVTATIHNTVARQNLETQASQLTFAQSSEEYAYIGLENNITLAYAYSLGFKDVSQKDFISQNSMQEVSFLSH